MDQKLENILNLALETPEEEREQTESLNVGYSAEIRSWELIVKYHGSLDRLREQNIVVEELIAGYAILTVPEALVDTVSDTPEIEYVEKPKRFYYGQTFPAGTSCFPPVTMRTPFLNGRGVLLAVLDSGITWDLEVFRKADGSTRIRYLWDQTVLRDRTRPQDQTVPVFQRMEGDDAEPPTGMQQIDQFVQCLFQYFQFLIALNADRLECLLGGMSVLPHLRRNCSFDDLV